MSVNLWVVLSVLCVLHWTKPIDGAQPPFNRPPYPNDVRQNRYPYDDFQPQSANNEHSQNKPTYSISDVHQMSPPYSANELHKSEPSNVDYPQYAPRPRHPPLPLPLPPNVRPPPPGKYSLSGLQGRLSEVMSSSNLKAMLGRRESGGYDGGCCGNLDFETTLPAYALLLITFFLLYQLNSAVTSSSGRRFDSVGSHGSDDEELLDAPAWLSMVQDLWEHDAEMADKSLSCAQRTLCRMNRVARSSPTKASWAVSLSSVPLSYLLHHRHQGGFTNYLDASLMGMSGANCSMIYSECPRLL